MVVARVQFPNSRGERLAGLIDLPDGREPLAWAIFAHCFTCSKDYRAPYHLGRALAAHGLGVLRFDFTGLGESEGDFTSTSFATNVDDLLAAARFLAVAHAPPRLLLGHSLGGAAAIEAAAQLPEIAALVTLATPADPRRLGERLRATAAPPPGPARRVEVAEAGGAVEVRIAGRPFRLGPSFFDDLRGVDLARTLSGLGRPLLVCHSPDDELVPLAEGWALLDQAAQPKSFLALAGADHLLSREKDARWAAAVIAAWAGPWIGLEE